MGVRVRVRVGPTAAAFQRLRLELNIEKPRVGLGLGLGLGLGIANPNPHPNPNPTHNPSPKQGDTVVMLCHGYNVLGARALGERRPRIGIEARRAEAGHEVLVAEGLVRAVGLRVVPVLVAPLVRLGFEIGIGLGFGFGVGVGLGFGLGSA